MKYTGLLAIAVLSAAVWSADVNITGTIVDTGGNPIEDALITCANIEYVALSTSNGEFAVTETAPVRKKPQTVLQNNGLEVYKGILHFILQQPQPIVFSAYTLQGKLCGVKTVSNLKAGSYQTNLSALIPNRMTSGTYIVSVSVGKNRVSEKILHRSGMTQLFKISSAGRNISSGHLARQLSTVDTVKISKLGYNPVRVPIESYTTDIGTVTLEKSTILSSPTSITEIEDSLLQELVDHIAQIGELDGPDELNTINFIELQTAFSAILEIDSMRVKSCFGYMTSSIASLNSNPDIWVLADSLDAYFSGFESESESVTLAKTALKKHGAIHGLSKVMLVKTPQILLSGTQDPSFPAFLTISYLQDLIERHILPILNNVAAVAERLEGMSDASMTILIDDDSYEIDKGEVCAFDASINLFRAFGYMFCTYDMDLFASDEEQNYSWIDALANAEEIDKITYSLSGDTLVRETYTEGEYEAIMALLNMFHYNMGRPDFMTIRRQFHTVAHNCLRNVPKKLKQGIEFIKNETDDQENDLLKIVMIDDADAEMVDFSQEMIDNGISEELAGHFSSLENIMDFFDSLLTGPYTFTETVDGEEISMTIDLSSFFTDPVNDLRTLLPLHAWNESNEWLIKDFDTTVSPMTIPTEYNSETGVDDSIFMFFVYDYDDEEVTIDIDQTRYTVEDMGYYKIYTLNTPVHFEVSVDTFYQFNALQLKDDQGNAMSFETIDSLINARSFFPYFTDYTYNGLFPDMTRQKWLDLLWEE